MYLDNILNNNMNLKMKNQILRDRMYNDLVQDYDTIGMSDQELSDTHDEIITIMDSKL
jgi:hypothetical protein